MSKDERINLKLLGKNQEDLKVISAYLQDSVLIVKDIVFLKKNRTFIMIVNRFMWEDAEKGVFRKNKRIRTILKFDNVIEVTYVITGPWSEPVIEKLDGVIVL